MASGKTQPETSDSKVDKGIAADPEPHFLREGKMIPVLNCPEDR